MQALVLALGVKGKEVLPFKLKEHDALIRSNVAVGVRGAFYVLDLGRFVDLNRCWRRALPDVRPFYVVKYNTDHASRREIESVLALGANTGSIVYANPCKPESHEVDLGTKYGARADELAPLLRAAERGGLVVVGVSRSFHVGSRGHREPVAGDERERLDRVRRHGRYTFNGVTTTDINTFCLRIFSTEFYLQNQPESN
jgi:ornithine decarboxylase